MTFIKGDANINTKGRIPDELKGKKTKREIREKDLLSLLRKFRPHVSDAITSAAKIMKDPAVSEQNRLKAVVVILDNYKELINDVYDAEDAEETGEEIQENPKSAVFSLRVVE